MFLLLSIATFLNFANEIRLDRTLPTEVEQVRQEQILDEVYHALPNYDSQNSLEEAIIELLKDSGINDVTLIDVGETEFKGKTSDRVFLVKDQDYVIKAFKNCTRLLPEISGLNLIQELKLTYVIPIRPLAVGRYHSWGLLLETKAKGKRLDEFLTDPHLKKALLRMAESLAELHQIKSPIQGPLPFLDNYDEKLKKIWDNPALLSELSHHFDLDDFKEYLLSVKKEAMDLSISYSYFHGDAHLGNMFYDEQEDHFYFIDVAKMHQSIDSHSVPLQDGSYDFFRASENFRRLSLGILKEEEFQYLLETFEQAYLEKQPLDPHHITFYKTYTKLGRLIEYFASMDAVFEEAITYFKQASLEIEIY